MNNDDDKKKMKMKKKRVRKMRGERSRISFTYDVNRSYLYVKTLLRGQEEMRSKSQEEKDMMDVLLVKKKAK